MGVDLRVQTAYLLWLFLGKTVDLELGFGKPQVESRADAKFYIASVMQNEQIGWFDFVCEGLGVVLILDSQTTNEF